MKITQKKKKEGVKKLPVSKCQLTQKRIAELCTKLWKVASDKVKIYQNQSRWHNSTKNNSGLAQTAKLELIKPGLRNNLPNLELTLKDLVLTQLDST